MKQLFLGLTLRTKISSMVVFFNLLMVLGGLWAFQKFEDAYLSKNNSSRADLARTLGEAISAQFFERYGDVQAFALNPVIRELNTGKLPEYLNEYVRLYGIYDIIVVVGKDGKYVGSNTKDAAGNPLNVNALREFDYSSQHWFREVMNGKFTTSKENGFSGTYFEDFHRDSLYEVGIGKLQLGTSFSAAIKNEAGDLVGVISNRTNNSWFELEIKSAYSSIAETLPDTEISLLNREGFVVSNFSPKSHQMKMVFDDAKSETLLKSNLFTDHEPVGTAMKLKQSGSMESQRKGEPNKNLVGYSYIDNKKWISGIGWSVAISSDAELAKAPVTKAAHSYYWVVFILGLFCLGLSMWLAFVVANNFSKLTQSLKATALAVETESSKVANQSSKLSEAAVEQAAALQESVTAIDEINAMVEKNAEAAMQSKSVSSRSRQAATNGLGAVEQMVEAIEEINLSNEEISSQMEQNSTQILEITKLISAIGQKTKVINEIVFQTKLLSFNAAVEAARAGEYGKGFSVVAEEVGGLAQMSGNAAKEISTLLEDSVRKVEEISLESSKKVERLINLSKGKIKIGADTAHLCNGSLKEILENVQNVDTLISEISMASQEQSSGMREISKAMGQLDAVTHQNTTVAQGTSLTADQLRAQSSDLNKVVQKLYDQVRGRQDSAASDPTLNSSSHGQHEEMDRFDQAS
jgi:methyl-accepting chemotaxis protein